MKSAPSTACTLAVALIAAAPATAAPRPDRALPGEIVLQIESGQSVHAVAATHRLTVLDQFGQRPIWRTRVAPDDEVAIRLPQVQRDARVHFAEEHFEHQTPEGRHHVVWAIGGSREEWAAQWAPDALRLGRAHAIATGAGVRIALLDTGIDAAHPTLAPQLARTGSGALIGHDFVDGDANPREEGHDGQPGYGHGTHVAGLAVLAAPGAKLMPARVLDPEGRGNTWVLAEALVWAVDPDGNPNTDDGAQVINLSLGTTKPTRLLDTAIELATCSDDDDDEEDDDRGDIGFKPDEIRCNEHGGAVVVAAAGNSGSRKEKQYPAAEDAEGQLSVAASASGRLLADFSNHARWIDLAAPGDAIVSTMPGNRWAVWSGTSMGAPLTAGVAALLREAYPDWKPVDVTERMLKWTGKLCDTTLRQVDAYGALTEKAAPRTACP